MFDNNYTSMGKHPCFNPGMAGGTMMYPGIYYKLQPFVMMACDEMDMYGIMMPTTRMITCICNRMCIKIFKMYPEMEKYDMEYPAGEMGDPPPGFDEFGRRFPEEFDEFGRRRFPEEFDEFGRRWFPEGFDFDIFSSSDPEGSDEFGHRRGPFRDFLAFLLLTEFFRRRRRMY